MEAGSKALLIGEGAKFGTLSTISESEEYKKLSTEAEQALEHEEQSEAEAKALETEKMESEQPEKADKSAPMRDAKTADAETSAESIAKAAEPTKSDRTETDTEASVISTAPRFGTQAYVTMQDSEDEKRSRSTIDTEA